MAESSEQALESGGLRDVRSLRLRVADDDQYASWDEIYLDNVVRVYRLLYAKVGNRADAEDLTTDVFVSSLRPLDTSASRGEIRAYLTTVARTALARYWRSRLGIDVTTIDVPADQCFVDDLPAESDAPRRAGRVLDGLPPRYRRVLELRFLDGLSVKEAARAMGVSVANAKVLQHRALRMAARADPGDE
ncbi:MAG TPA: sigma-70 family RNA polymerase sigma factor [Acidimicrobiia bacterium]|jgi:RNA polymerase sigma-70 factor (ECF subfamily)